jgi:hypothetical protein
MTLGNSWLPHTKW